MSNPVYFSLLVPGDFSLSRLQQQHLSTGTLFSENVASAHVSIHREEHLRVFYLDFTSQPTFPEGYYPIVQGLIIAFPSSILSALNHTTDIEFLK